MNYQSEQLWNYVTKGIQLYQANKPDEAIQEFDKAINLNSVFADAYANRAIAFQIKGMVRRAYLDINVALKIDSSSQHWYATRALLNLHIGNWNGVISDCYKFLQMNNLTLDVHCIYSWFMYMGKATGK